MRPPPLLYLLHCFCLLKDNVLIQGLFLTNCFPKYSVTRNVVPNLNGLYLVLYCGYEHFKALLVIFIFGKKNLLTLPYGFPLIRRKGIHETCCDTTQ